MSVDRVVAIDKFKTSCMQSTTHLIWLQQMRQRASKDMALLHAQQADASAATEGWCGLHGAVLKVTIFGWRTLEHAQMMMHKYEHAKFSHNPCYAPAVSSLFWSGVTMANGNRVVTELSHDLQSAPEPPDIENRGMYS